MKITEEQKNLLAEKFYAELADMFPEIQSGDLPPHTVIEFELAIENTANEWLAINK